MIEIIMPKQVNKQQTLLQNLTTLIIVFVLPIGIVLGLNTFLIKNYSVPSASMETTLMTGDRFFGLKTYNYEPQHGNIIVFEDNQRWLPSENIIIVKRVIGIPGDAIECCTADNKIIVNGEPVQESYISSPNQPFELQTVPDGHVFLLGDNRSHSSDSRAHIPDGTQFVPISSIEATALYRYWPFKEASTIQ